MIFGSQDVCWSDSIAFPASFDRLSFHLHTHLIYLQINMCFMGWQIFTFAYKSEWKKMMLLSSTAFRLKKRYAKNRMEKNVFQKRSIFSAIQLWSDKFHQLNFSNKKMRNLFLTLEMSTTKTKTVFVFDSSMLRITYSSPPHTLLALFLSFKHLLSAFCTLFILFNTWNLKQISWL
jgi:hypothetical protein